MVLDFTNISNIEQSPNQFKESKTLQAQIFSNLSLILITAYLNMKINETFDVINYLNSNESSQFNFKQPPCIEELKTILETDVAKSTGARQKLADKMKKDVIDKLL